MPTKLADISQSTLGELIELAIEKELVEFCYIASRIVVLSMGGHQLSYAPDEARSFLRSLVQGWSRSRAPSAQGAWGLEPGRGLPFAPAEAEAARPQPGEPAGQRPPAPGRAAAPGEAQPAAPAERRPPRVVSSEDYIDAVLSFAEEMQLIEGFDKDRVRGRVTLRTQATTTEMTYFETLEYLTNSILHELRSKQSS